MSIIRGSTVFPPLQVTVEYRLEEGACVPLRVHTVVVSVQHSEDISLEDMRSQIKERIIKVSSSCFTEFCSSNV